MLSDLLSSRTDLPERQPFPAETREHLLRYAVPHDIVEDLEKCCFAAWVGVGPFDLVPMVELVKQTWGVMECCKQGYVVIAGCRNFDPVAIDVKTGQIVIVCYAVMGDDELPQFEHCLIPTSLSYEQFWQAASSDPQFPRDSYAAEQRWPRAGKSI